MEQDTQIIAKTNLPEPKKVGRKYLIPIFLTSKKKEIKDGREVVTPKSMVLSLTPMQYDVVMSFSKSWSLEQTAVETGKKVESIKRILRHPVVKQYVEEIRKRTAAKLDTDIPWLIERLRSAAEGITELTDTQKFALKEVGRMFAPKTPSVAVQVNNNHYDGDVYKDERDIEDAWAKRKAAAD